MAKLILSDRECDNDELPRICMKCGEPSQHYKSRNMKWSPPWVMWVGLGAFLFIGVLGLLVFYAVSASSRKTMRMTTTFCDEHKNYWWHLKLYGSLLPALGLIALIAGGITAAVLAAQPRFANQEEFTLAAGVSGVVIFFIMLVIGVIFNKKAIKATEITEYDITLIHIHPEYVYAVKEQRAERRERRRERELAEDEAYAARPKARPVFDEPVKPQVESFDAQRRRDWGDG